VFIVLRLCYGSCVQSDVLSKASVPASAEIGQGTTFGHDVVKGGFVHRRVAVGERSTSGQQVPIGDRSCPFEVSAIGDRVYAGVGLKTLGSVQAGHGAATGANALVIDGLPVGSPAGRVPVGVVRENTDIDINIECAHFRTSRNSCRDCMEVLASVD
jgi:serine acetyltransferase